MLIICGGNIGFWKRTVRGYLDYAVSEAARDTNHY